MAEEEIKKTTAEANEAQAPKAKAAKKGKRIVNSGAVHIQATFNNTIISVTDKERHGIRSWRSGREST